MAATGSREGARSQSFTGYRGRRYCRLAAAADGGNRARAASAAANSHLRPGGR